MPAPIATIVFALGIIGLFVLDRDRGARKSIALWLPVIWLSIGGSRMVSEWLQPPSSAISTDMISTAEQVIDGSPLDRNILMTLIALGVTVLLTRRETVGRLLRSNAPILLFFLYCAVSTLWSDYPFVALKRWTKAFGDLVMVLIVLTDLDPSAAVKRVLARVSFFLIPLSILLIKYYPELGRGYENWTWTPTVTGVTTGKNLLGMICMVCGLGSVWRLLYPFRAADGTRTAGPLIAHGTLLAMAIWLFWQANSITALSCFLIATGVTVATTSRAIRTGAMVHVLVASVLIIAFGVLFLDLGEGLLHAMGRDPTLTGRTQVWSVALQYSGDPLLGTGFESFWLGERLQKIWSIYWWHPNEAHNGYLEVFLNLGLIGIALLAVLMAVGYRNVIRALRRDPDIGSFKLGFFVAAVAYNFTEASIRTFQPIWVIFLLTILAVPDAKVRFGIQDSSASAPRSGFDPLTV